MNHGSHACIGQCPSIVCFYTQFVPLFMSKNIFKLLAILCCLLGLESRNNYNYIYIYIFHNYTIMLLCITNIPFIFISGNTVLSLVYYIYICSIMLLCITNTNFHLLSFQIIQCCLLSIIPHNSCDLVSLLLVHVCYGCVLNIVSS